MLNTSGPSDLNAGLDFFAANPQWMVFVCIAVPALVMMAIGAFMDRGDGNHRRTKTSVAVPTVIKTHRPTQRNEDHFDFDKITFYYNEIGNERKELIS